MGLKSIGKFEGRRKNIARGSAPARRKGPLSLVQAGLPDLPRGGVLRTVAWLPPLVQVG